MSSEEGRLVEMEEGMGVVDEGEEYFLIPIEKLFFNIFRYIQI